jgi:hypothetical protein
MIGSSPGPEGGMSVIEAFLTSVTLSLFPVSNSSAVQENNVVHNSAHAPIVNNVFIFFMILNFYLRVLPFKKVLNFVRAIHQIALGSGARRSVRVIFILPG